MALRSDPLFGGLTRPASMLGLPVEVLIFVLAGATIAFLLAGLLHADVNWKIAALGMGCVLYGMARLVCARDPRALRYVGLQLNTKARHMTRDYWHSGSYGPLASRKRR
ncbi:type IV secretion system protein VirB3 [Dyella sp.]|uniref:type IV secretion system protein VirB3 n=1 Tax=Dyella sp. TaxID=1869338 RepID=UPI002ED0BD7F